MDMKLKTYFAVALAALMTAACSDDEKGVNPVENIAGTYSGYSEAAFQYITTPMVTDGESLSITVNSDGTTATVSYTSGSFGEFTIDNATVSYASGSYTLSGSGSTLMGMGDQKSEYPCTLTGSLNEGRTEGSIAFDVPGVMGGMTITFYLGDAPLSKLLAGDYSGWTDASCAYFPSFGVTADETFSMAANDDDSFTLAYTSATWGQFTFNSITATATADGYTFSGEGTCQMGMSGNVSDYPCTVEGNLDASREAGTVTFNVPAVMGGLTITFTLGDAPEGGTTPEA